MRLLAARTLKALCLFAALAGAEENATWETDLAAGLARAAERKQPVFVYVHDSV